MGKEARRGWLAKSLEAQAARDSVRRSWLVSWRVTLGKGEDREVRFIPREKPDREGRGRCERKREIPLPGGVAGQGAMEPSGGWRKGKSQLWGDMTDSALLPPETCLCHLPAEPPWTKPSTLPCLSASSVG